MIEVNDQKAKDILASQSISVFPTVLYEPEPSEPQEFSFEVLRFLCAPHRPLHESRVDK